MVNRYRGFDADFRRLQVPALVRAIQWWAELVAEGWVEFSDAVGEVMATAMSLGAGWLTEGTFADLEDWVLTEIAEVVAELRR